MQVDSLSRLRATSSSAGSPNYHARFTIVELLVALAMLVIIAAASPVDYRPAIHRACARVAAQKPIPSACRAILHQQRDRDGAR